MNILRKLFGGSISQSQREANPSSIHKAAYLNDLKLYFSCLPTPALAAIAIRSARRVESVFDPSGIACSEAERERRLARRVMSVFPTSSIADFDLSIADSDELVSLISSRVLEHFHDCCTRYPQCRNRAAAFSAVMVLRASVMA